MVASTSAAALRANSSSDDAAGASRASASDWERGGTASGVSASPASTTSADAASSAASPASAAGWAARPIRSGSTPAACAPSVRPISANASCSLELRPAPGSKSTSGSSASGPGWSAGGSMSSAKPGAATSAGRAGSAGSSTAGSIARPKGHSRTTLANGANRPIPGSAEPFAGGSSAGAASSRASGRKGSSGTPAGGVGGAARASRPVRSRAPNPRKPAKSRPAPNTGDAARTTGSAALPLATGQRIESELQVEDDERARARRSAPSGSKPRTWSAKGDPAAGRTGADSASNGAGSACIRIPAASVRHTNRAWSAPPSDCRSADFRPGRSPGGAAAGAATVSDDDAGFPGPSRQEPSTGAAQSARASGPGAWPSPTAATARPPASPGMSTRWHRTVTIR